MANQFKVAPSILSADFANLQSEIEKLEQAGADWIHVDVMDGHFVPNLTIGMPVVKAIRKVCSIPLDVHLMIDEPENYVDQFIDAGANYLTIHVESTKKVTETLKRIRQRGCKSGLTLRPGTPVAEMFPYLDQVDLGLVMTVEPGFGGQGFLHEQVRKINQLRAECKRQGLDNFLIEVDGGITDQTKELCRAADVLVAGNFVFRHNGGYKSAITALR